MTYEVYNIAAPGKEVVRYSPPENISLGEEGRGRTLTIIPVLGETGDFVQVAKTPTGIVLLRTEEPPVPPSATLVVINTDGGYSQYRQYHAEVVDSPSENYTILAKGVFAEGIAGRAGSASHELALVQPETTIFLRSKYSVFYYRWDGERWTVETTAQYKARKALEAFEAGGVEWL